MWYQNVSETSCLLYCKSDLQEDVHHKLDKNVGKETLSRENSPSFNQLRSCSQNQEHGKYKGLGLKLKLLRTTKHHFNVYKICKKNQRYLGYEGLYNFTK
jgi:hypothetical protein